MIDWTVNRRDLALIELIAERAANSGLCNGPRIDLLMDLTATHRNGCPLRLHDLLRANDFDFAHDVIGIRRHIDHETGKLGDCFVPRTADLSTL